MHKFSFVPHILFLLLTTSACLPPSSTKTAVPSTPVVLMATSLLSTSRYGTVELPAVHSSGVTATFTAKENGDGSTSLRVQVRPADPLNPWGIYNVGDCVNGIPVNTLPIVLLADIENGHKEETVETATYKSAPRNLIVAIFRITPGHEIQMVACADLGGPLVDRNAAPPTADCLPSAAASPQPDPGTWLAFSAAVNNNSDIYLLNVDSVQQGKDPIAKRLTTDPAADFDPTWSPDGSRIAFRSQRDGNDEIYVMNANGTCQMNITHNSLADWSPDGTQIAFSRFFGDNSFTDIALIRPDGSGLKRLTTAHGEYPAWSPDGTKIAFASARDGNYEIYVMNADGSDQTRLTNNPAYDMSPTWSPDETRIAFDTQRDHFPPAETGIGPEFEIDVLSVDGSNDLQLTNNNHEDRFPSWGANGLIAFARDGSLFVMNADGTQQIELLDSGSFPAWGPLSIAEP